MTDQTVTPISRYILPVLYGALFVLLFAASYQLMLVWWKNPDYNYCSLVPLIAGYLLWERRQALSLPSAPSLAGVAVVALGIFLYLLGELGGEYYTIYFSSWVMLVGLLWLHFGWEKLRAIAFPVSMLVAMFPLPMMINSTITLRLKLLSSTLGVKILLFSGVSVFQEGNIIDLGFTRMEVVEACSGLRFFFPLILVAILLAAHQKARFWQRALLVLSAVPLSVVTNGLRIAGMGWLYPVMGNDIIEGFWHEFLGWLLFMLTIGLFIVEMRLFLWLAPVKPGAGSEAPASNRVSTIRPVPRQRTVLPLALVALVMLGATATAVRTINFREQLPLARPMAEFPMTIGEWQGKTSELEQKYLEQLKLSDYLLADYVNGKGQTVSLYVAYNESQRKGYSSHSPATCLPGSGWIFKDSGMASIPAGSDGTMAEVKRSFMEKNGARMMVYYWFPQRGRILTNLFQLKWYTFVDALTKQRTDGALVRVLTTVYDQEQPADAEARLQGFIRDVGPQLNGFLPGK
jgi:exosortase D (VPLPA-CTERM-specific)